MLQTKPIDAIGVISFSLTIILLVFFLCAFNDEFYAKEFQKYGVKQQLGGHDAFALHSEVMDFLKDKGKLDDPFFSEREREHMHDVKSLFNAARIAWIVSMISFFLICISSIYGKKISKIGRMIDIGSRVTIAFVIVLAVFSVISFPILFELFHKIFFSGQTYLFDPSTEKIVVLYPDGLFFDFFATLAFKIVVLCALISVCIFLLEKKYAPKNAKKRNL